MRSISWKSAQRFNFFLLPSNPPHLSSYFLILFFFIRSSFLFHHLATLPPDVFFIHPFLLHCSIILFSPLCLAPFFFSIPSICLFPSPQLFHFSLFFTLFPSLSRISTHPHLPSVIPSIHHVCPSIFLSSFAASPSAANMHPLYNMTSDTLEIKATIA